MFFRISLFLLVIGMLSFPVVLFAQEETIPPAPVTGDWRDTQTTQLGAFAGQQGAGFDDGTGVQDPRIVVARIIKYLLGLTGILFLAYTVYAGFLWLTSAGEEEKITKAKSTIRTTTIGILIVLMAYGITTFVSNSLIRATDGRDTYQSNTIDLRLFDW